MSVCAQPSVPLMVEDCRIRILDWSICHWPDARIARALWIVFQLFPHFLSSQSDWHIRVFLRLKGRFHTHVCSSESKLSSFFPANCDSDHQRSHLPRKTRLHLNKHNRVNNSRRQWFRNTRLKNWQLVFDRWMMLKNPSLGYNHRSKRKHNGKYLYHNNHGLECSG